MQFFAVIFVTKMLSCFGFENDDWVQQAIEITPHVKFLHAMSDAPFAQQPLSLFQSAAKILWKSKQTQNCIYCWLASCHLARFYTQIAPIDMNIAQFDVTQFDCNVDNTSDQPETYSVNRRIVVYNQEFSPELGSNFVLHCNKSIVKKFMLLHCLYTTNQISNCFTNQAVNSRFGFRILFECVNKYEINIPVSRSCYQIFIDYLSEYLNWMSVTDIQLYNTNRYKFFQVPNQVVITNMVAPYSRNLLHQNFTLVKPISNPANRTSPVFILSDDSVNQTFASTLCSLNDCWLSICVTIMSVFSVGIVTYLALHIFHLI